jgi:hypothetical protein
VVGVADHSLVEVAYLNVNPPLRVGERPEITGMTVAADLYRRPLWDGPLTTLLQPLVELHGVAAYVRVSRTRHLEPSAFGEHGSAVAGGWKRFGSHCDSDRSELREFAARGAGFGVVAFILHVLDQMMCFRAGARHFILRAPTEQTLPKPNGESAAAAKQRMVRTMPVLPAGALMLSRAPTLMRLATTALLVVLGACSQLSDKSRPAPDKNASRAQLSIGYSQLYQEADGIPKLKWLLMFKDKPEEMGRLTNDLTGYYRQLAETMKKLSKQYPAMRIDAPAMSEIEGEERKAMGADMAKDFAPLVGKTGIEFEREALLMFYNALNEQRHLTGVMIGLEKDPGLKKFLETTHGQLEERYAAVGALLNRRYFTH